jgi:hypothetical protein
MKTTIERVHYGVRKPPWDGCAMVYENHRGAGAMVYRNRRWAGGQWCTKTADRWVCDGVRELPLGGAGWYQSMVR